MSGDIHESSVLVRLDLKVPYRWRGAIITSTRRLTEYFRGEMLSVGVEPFPDAAEALQEAKAAHPAGKGRQEPERHLRVVK